MKYSLIVPVYNRPDEVKELLESLLLQTYKDFEVIIVEDGSQIPCEEIVNAFATQLPIHYYTKNNSGPGLTRNAGVSYATGEYVIILDSDCILPSTYLEEVEKEIRMRPSDAFGGGDRAHADFTPIQKAINYAMTSFFTTGGIRGGKRKLDKFYPRSFNMGVKREVYQALGGFSEMRFGEDIDFSIRIFKGGYTCRLFPEAWVWHKRRTDLKKFFKQVHNSGIARINLYLKYPDSLKIVHILPALFTIGVLCCCLLSVFYPLFFCFIIAYALLVGIDAAWKNKSLWIGLLAIPATFVQLLGYGSGFLMAWWKRCILHKKKHTAFEKNFYD